jgi:HK97 family phage prohead protease
MPKELITRSYFQIEDVEIREANGKPTIAGYAAVFEKLSVPIYNFKEKIRAGAFANSLKKNNVRALWNHNPDMVLGSIKAGTLRLFEDERGLRFELDPPDTQAGKDAVISIRRKDVDGMSFGFNILRQEWDEGDRNNIVRTLIEVDLREVSPTAFPAYPDTKVKVRNIEDDYDEHARSVADADKEIRVNELKIMENKISILEREVV